MKTAFLFPGQGAQKVGMGKDLYEKYECVKNTYKKASEISGIDIASLCFDGIRKEYKGDEYVESNEKGEALNLTENTQLAIATMSLSILEVLKEKSINSDIVAGLSLGEYSALVYANVIDFESGIKLLKRRGYLMGNKVPNADYSMLAVIGMDTEIIENVCSEIRNTGKFVVPANYNYSGQTVISGMKEAVEEAEKILKEKGAKKVVTLKTSGPFHTELLKQASDEFKSDLTAVNYGEPQKQVIKNINGEVYCKEDNIPEILSKHIISSVRFDKTILKMKNEGVDTFVEIGPGKALTGFIKKEFSDANVINIYDVSSLEDAILKLKGE